MKALRKFASAKGMLPIVGAIGIVLGMMGKTMQWTKTT